MDALRLALQGLRARRGVGLVLLAVAVAAVAAAAAGPLYLRAGQESLLRDEVAAAPAAATGLEFSTVTDGRADVLGRLEHDVDELTGDLPAYSAPIGGVELGIQVLTASGDLLATSRLTYRQGVCAHVVIVQGRCPSAAGEVALSVDGARTLGAGPGARLPVSRTLGGDDEGLRVTVVGLWQVRDVSEPYWFGHDYFVALQGLSGGTAVDVLLTPESTFGALPPPSRTTLPLGTGNVAKVLVDRPADPRRIGLADVPALRAGLSTLPDRFGRRDPGVRVEGYLPFTLDTAARAGAGLRRPVALVTGQLLVLAWFVLYTVVAGATSARGLEVALAKLRGFSPVGTVLFALLETVLVLLAATPLGLLVGYGAVRLLAATALGPAVPVAFTPLSAAAAAGALAGALVAALLAAVRVVRQPVLALLRRATSAHRGPVAVVCEAALLVVAVGGLLRVVRVSAQAPSTAALLAPGLIAVVTALVCTRLLPVACRAAFRITRDRQRVGAFLAVRQVARRPAGLRVVLVLGTAFGLATFAVVGDSVFRGNRADRAKAETGAAEVLSVDAGKADRLLGIVRTADPGGRRAMAVVTYDGGSNDPIRLVGVDTTRLATVPYWRDDLSPLAASAAARALRPGALDDPVPALLGTEVDVSPGGVEAAGLDGLAVPLRVAGRLGFVPRFGPRAAVADLAGLQARVSRPIVAARAEVWLAPGGQPAVVARLRAAGLRIDRTELAETRADRFGRQAPSLALQLFLAGAGAAAVLALGGTVLELFLVARRRAYEVAAMAVVGLRRRQLVASILGEQALVLGTGVLAGIGAGLLAVRLTLPVVPEFSDHPAFPAIVLTPAPLFVAGLLGAVVTLLAVGVGLTAALLVRSAVPARLREAQP